MNSVSAGLTTPTEYHAISYKALAQYLAIDARLDQGNAADWVAPEAALEAESIRRNWVQGQDRRRFGAV